MGAITKDKLLWALQLAIGAYFIVLAALNFIGIAPMVAQFETIGIGQWFRYLTGLCQLAGGVMLFTPRFSAYGALLLACVMAGAIAIRIVILGGNPAVAGVLLLINGFIAWQRLSK